VGKDEKTVATEVAYCNDIDALLSANYHEDSTSISRIKIGVDDGGSFVKYTMGIVGFPCAIAPSSVNGTLLIGVHHLGERYQNLKQVFDLFQNFLINHPAIYMQFIGDLKILNCLHGITLGGKFGCIYCFIDFFSADKDNFAVDGSNAEDEPVFERRTFEDNQERSARLISDSKKNKSVNNPSIILQFLAKLQKWNVS
jgi:hypothetical protein